MTVCFHFIYVQKNENGWNCREIYYSSRDFDNNCLPGKDLISENQQQQYQQKHNDHFFNHCRPPVDAGNIV